MWIKMLQMNKKETEEVGCLKRNLAKKADGHRVVVMAEDAFRGIL